MNIEELKKQIKIKKIPCDLGIEVIAKWSVYANAMVSTHVDYNSEQMAHLEEVLREQIVRHIYDDHRKALYEIVDKLLQCNPYQPNDLYAILNELMHIVRYQPPITY